jgi:hypothetical protein
MTRRSLLTVVLAVVLALALVAVAAAATKSKSKTVTVAKGTTRTVVVAYPDALKFPNATYKCAATVTKGDKKKVKISKGSAQGGSVCQAKITNRSRGSATVKVTATTNEPEQQG